MESPELTPDEQKLLDALVELSIEAAIEDQRMIHEVDLRDEETK